MRHRLRDSLPFAGNDERRIELTELFVRRLTRIEQEWIQFARQIAETKKLVNKPPGPTRKRALLMHFGTLKAIENASLADLAQVPGISADSARRIYDYFHDKTS